MTGSYSLAVHGGAGTIDRAAITAEQESGYRKALLSALEAGEGILAGGGSSLDAVKAAVVSLENCPLFNAGKGSVFTHEGRHEMDASIMCGRTLEAGAVAGVSHVRNPILLADLVRVKTNHVFLYGHGAEMLAKENQVPFEAPDYFHDDFRYKQWLAVRDSDHMRLDHFVENKEKKFGTVGAVACDRYGNLAAATSTGGMTNKRYNRIGDTPLIGAGNYANNKSCAVSCTGHGEYFIRSVVAYDVSCLMEYKGLSLKEACSVVVHDKLVKLGGEGGLIAVDVTGAVEMVFNSEGMYRGMLVKDQPAQVLIYKQ